MQPPAGAQLWILYVNYSCCAATSGTVSLHSPHMPLATTISILKNIYISYHYITTVRKILAGWCQNFETNEVQIFISLNSVNVL